jgi:hypothetical protein
MSRFDPSRSRKRRPIGETKEPKKTFLIYCEGQTELEYFQYFKNFQRLPNLNIKTIDLRENGNALTLAKEAIQRKKMQEKEYDEYWIVLDKDDTKNSDFSLAIELCQQNEIQTAYSIQAFEVWILLHFQFFDDKCERTFLKEKINEHLKPLKYSKSKEELQIIFKEIFPKIKDAVKNAKLGFQKFEEDNIPIPERESCSSVFLIIERILQTGENTK